MELLHYLPQVLSGWNLLILIGGTIVGLILGATPGLSPTMAVALLIPFTFKMDATSGLILLGVLYTSTVAGGGLGDARLSHTVHALHLHQSVPAFTLFTRYQSLFIFNRKKVELLIRLFDLR